MPEPGMGSSSATSPSSSSSSATSNNAASGGGSSNDSTSNTTADNLANSNTAADNLSSSPTTADTLSGGENKQVDPVDNSTSVSSEPGVVENSTPAANDSNNDSNNDDSAVASTVAGATTAHPGLKTVPEAKARAAMAEHLDDIKQRGTGKKDTVGAVIVDHVTGETHTGVNQKTDIENPHQVLKDRIEAIDNTKAHNSYPGRHAEADALNKALHAREQHNKAKGIPGPVTENSLSSMTLDTNWVKNSANPKMQDGTAAPRCANCTQITDGVNNLPGDSTMNYSDHKAGGKPGTPPRSEFATANRQSARTGALIGSSAGAAMSTVEALADGKITTAEAGKIATDTIVGAGTGALGEVLENSVTRMADRAAGQGIQQSVGAGARVAGTRMAGAGAAGAVIGAGFATVDQVQAYQRGEVSGSEAAGKIAAETMTGAAAGMSGAAIGAAVGSVIPGAGTAVGAVVGFGAGMVAGYLADKGLRASGVTDAVASGVTSAIDTVSGWGSSLKSAFGW